MRWPRVLLRITGDMTVQLVVCALALCLLEGYTSEI